MENFISVKCSCGEQLTSFMVYEKDDIINLYCPNCAKLIKTYDKKTKEKKNG